MGCLWRQEDGLKSDMREPDGVMEIFSILIEKKVTWVYIHICQNLRVHTKSVHFAVTYTSIYKWNMGKRTEDMYSKLWKTRYK